MQNPFSWDYLTAPVSETSQWGPFAIAMVASFAAGFIIALFFYYDADRRMKFNRVLVSTVKRGAMIAMGVFGLGLLFFGFRYLQINALGLHMRLWPFLISLLAIAMLVGFWYYIRNIYPSKVAALEARQQKQEYLNRPAHGKSRKRSRKKQARQRSS